MEGHFLHKLQEALREQFLAIHNAVTVEQLTPLPPMQYSGQEPLNVDTLECRHPTLDTFLGPNATQWCLGLDFSIMLASLGTVANTQFIQ